MIAALFEFRGLSWAFNGIGSLMECTYMMLCLLLAAGRVQRGHPIWYGRNVSRMASNLQPMKSQVSPASGHQHSKPNIFPSHWQRSVAAFEPYL